jgi:DNA-binding PadR family transcriptional regulator|tara:strand:+ start:274 stop:441 length:168 start_codon:yes stop_codon:yes gene_type:complete
MEEYTGHDEFEATLDRMLSSLVDDGILSMSWDEVDGLVYFMTDEQKEGIRVLYHS